jgi:thiol-disulfide isomerase/thioredoxin
MDSVLFPSFAEGLGIDVFNETHATVSVIIEAANEQVYLLDHGLASKSSPESGTTTISKRSIYEFVKNYTEGSLMRYKRSSTQGRTSSSEQCLKESDGRNIVCVPEISSDMFREVVLNPSKDVVLMYYTPWCGYCTSIAHIYLSVARYFVGVEGILFARINADKNDLPFEYTVDRYPTILFFPAKRKTESVVYPHNMPITTTSLVQFVLGQGQPVVRYQTSFQLCNRPCLGKNLASYSSQWRRLSRRIKAALNEIQRVKSRLRDKSSLIMRSTRLQLEEYVQYLVSSVRKDKAKFRSLQGLRRLLIARISSLGRSASSELGQDLLQDMMMLIQQQQAQAHTMFTPAPKQPAKGKAKSKGKKEPEVESKAKKGKAKAKSKKEEL